MWKSQGIVHYRGVITRLSPSEGAEEWSHSWNLEGGSPVERVAFG